MLPARCVPRFQPGDIGQRDPFPSGGRSHIWHSNGESELAEDVPRRGVSAPGFRFSATVHSIAWILFRIDALSASSAAISAMISFGSRNAVSSALRGFLTERS